MTHVHGAVTPGLAMALLVIVMFGTVYAAGVRRHRAWAPARSMAFLAGIAVMLLALAPPLAARAHGDLRLHMLQHLLLGMLAPLLLVLGAPLTLALATLPRRAARALVRLLHRRPVRMLVHPLTALVLNIGGMALLYLTPLYLLSRQSPALHGLVHYHFVAAGFLYAAATVGPDRIPGRPSPAWRGGVLFSGMALHAILAKAMYAHGWPAGTGLPVLQVQEAAMWMYYGGDIIELAMFAVFFRGLLRERSVPVAAASRDAQQGIDGRRLA